MISKRLVIFVALLALTASAFALVQDEQAVYKACRAKGAKQVRFSRASRLFVSASPPHTPSTPREPPQKAFQKSMNNCVFAAIPSAAACPASCAYLLKSTKGNKKCRATLYRFLTQLNEVSVPTMKNVRLNFLSFGTP
jgi:hypothetical protein